MRAVTRVGGEGRVSPQTAANPPARRQPVAKRDHTLEIRVCPSITGALGGEGVRRWGRDPIHTHHVVKLDASREGGRGSRKGRCSVRILAELDRTMGSLTSDSAEDMQSVNVFVSFTVLVFSSLFCLIFLRAGGPNQIPMLSFGLHLLLFFFRRKTGQG